MSGGVENMNAMDIIIRDLQGNAYDINNINMFGNDCMEIIIKKPNEDYLPLRTTFEKEKDNKDEYSMPEVWNPKP